MYGIYENNKIIAQFVVPMTMRSNQPVFVSDTLSLKRVVRKRAAQRWELDTRLTPLSTSAQDLMVSFITKGHYGTLTIIVPQNYGVISARTSTSTPNAVGSAFSSQLTVTGNSGLISKGTFVNFTGDTKLYMTTSDLTDNGTLNIFPTLRKDVSGAMRHLDNVLMSCKYDTDTVIGMTYENGTLMDNGIIKLVEVL